jgi:hypothetical protein
MEPLIMESMHIKTIASRLGADLCGITGSVAKSCVRAMPGF